MVGGMVEHHQFATAYFMPPAEVPPATIMQSVAKPVFASRCVAAAAVDGDPKAYAIPFIYTQVR